MNNQNNDRNNDTKKSCKPHHKPLFKGEKSLDHAKKENKSRIKSLRKVGSDDTNALAGKLENCCSKDRCKSPACAICNWFTRRRHVKGMRRILKGSLKRYHVTIVPTGWYFGPPALNQINIKQLKDTLRKRMERAGLGNALVIGGIEAVYKFKKKRYCLHWHLMCGNCSIKEINKLRSSFFQDRQMRIDPIDPGDEKYVYSYGIKNVTFGKDPDTGYPKRPAPKIHAAHMQFLDRHKFRELMFMRGVRFNGDKLGIIKK